MSASLDTKIIDRIAGANHQRAELGISLLSEAEILRIKKEEAYVRTFLPGDTLHNSHINKDHCVEFMFVGFTAHSHPTGATPFRVVDAGGNESETAIGPAWHQSFDCPHSL